MLMKHIVVAESNLRIVILIDKRIYCFYQLRR